MIERINVQVFLFTIKPEFKVLLLKRTPKRGGFWQPISGGVEEGESTYDTIKRELLEETGLENIKKIYDLDYTFVFQAPISRKWMRDICFAVELERIFNIRLSDEHEKFRWCNENEAKNILKWKYNLIALNKLLKIINNPQL